MKRRDGWHEMTGPRDRWRTGFQHCNEMGHGDAPVLTDKAELVRTRSHSDPERHPSPSKGRTGSAGVISRSTAKIKSRVAKHFETKSTLKYT